MMRIDADLFSINPLGLAPPDAHFKRGESERMYCNIFVTAGSSAPFLVIMIFLELSVTII
jgi:hypothetical protein